MAVAQGVLANIAYKAYASGAMVSNTEDLLPPASGAQFLRRVSSNLDLKKNTYKATEIRPDLQVASFRHGGRSVAGDIAGELSPSTYFDFFEAVHRDTRVAGASSDQSALTSIAMSHSGSTITFTGGDPLTLTPAFSVGDVITTTGNTTSANDNTNFLITAMGGTTGRIWTVFPAPLDSTASTTFTVTAAGHHTIIPSTGQVNRKYGIEIYDTDVTVSRLFTEVRATKYAIALPTSGIVTTTISFMGRDMVPVDSSRYFTTPTAVTTPDTTTSTSGVVMVNGVSLGLITALSLDCTLAAASADVVGQTFSADILLGTAVVTGQMTAYLADVTLLNDFLNESEVAIAVMVQSNTAANSPAISFYLPRVKFSGAAVNLTGEAGQIITMPFQALLYQGAAAGVPLTTIRIADTSA
jgi:hypothetical protein